MDYGMPQADNTPSFTTEIAEILSPTNPLGIKAGGEGGTTPALSVTVSAIVDALSVYGIHHITMPATYNDARDPVHRMVRHSSGQGE
jgi:carbon-monoxide dehydrogenase large subunit